MITFSSLLPEVITVQDFVLAISLLKVIRQITDEYLRVPDTEVIYVSVMGVLTFM